MGLAVLATAMSLIQVKRQMFVFSFFLFAGRVDDQGRANEKENGARPR